MSIATPPADGSLRLDRWLWAARLYKTRALAVDAIAMGRVEVNGVAAKPARQIRAGDLIAIRRPPHRHELVVRGIATRRVSAVVAQTLYEETAASIAARAALEETLAMDAIVEHRRGGKLSKKERRQRELLKRAYE